MRISAASVQPQSNLAVLTVEKRVLETTEFPESTGALAELRNAGPDAFRPIFGRYSKPVLVFIYSLIGDRDRAEELTQETFIRAYHRLHTVRPDSRLSTWLFGIARNVVREAIREKYRRLRKASEPLSADFPDTRSRPDEQLISQELQRAIQAALLSLPEDQRIVFVLKLITEMRYEEIAEVTGASVGKLKTDLHRARLKIREELQPYLESQASTKRGAL